MALSLLVLVGCKDKGGSQNQPVAVAGVIPQAYNELVASGESCTMGTNSYTCTQYAQYSQMGPRTLTIGFSSVLELCAILRDEQRNQNIAFQTRQLIINRQCYNSGYNNGINNGINNGPCGIGMIYQNGMCVQGGINNGINTGASMPDMKNVVCQLYIEKDGRIGDTGLLDVKVQQNNKSGVNIFAFTNHEIRKTFLGIFHYGGNIVSTSEKMAKVKMYYTKETGKADMIKLEVTGVDNNLSATVTGFAGSDTKLEIAPQDQYSDATKLSISCKSAQAVTTGSAAAYKAYRCKGVEKDGSVVTEIVSADPYDDSLMNQALRVSKSTKLYTEGGLATNEGTASFEQLARHGIDSSVTTKANVTTPSAISVRRPNYRLDVECKPSVF